MSKAFRAAFHRLVHRLRPFPVGSRLVIARYGHFRAPCSVVLWNLDYPQLSAFPCRMSTRGSRVAVGLLPIWRGVAPAGVGISASRLRRASRVVLEDLS
jgi:hypothetical protein